MISIGEVEARVEALRAGAGDDPEADHGERDGLLLAALRAIAGGHPEPQEMAAAALKVADADMVLWSA